MEAAHYLTRNSRHFLQTIWYNELNETGDYAVAESYLLTVKFMPYFVSLFHYYSGRYGTTTETKPAEGFDWTQPSENAPKTTIHDLTNYKL